MILVLEKSLISPPKFCKNHVLVESPFLLSAFTFGIACGQALLGALAAYPREPQESLLAGYIW